MANPEEKPRAWRQFLWLVAIWAMSVAGFAALTYGFRSLLPRKPAPPQAQPAPQGLLDPGPIRWAVAPRISAREV